METLESCFSLYTIEHAPFMHAQYEQWRKSRPLLGLRVLHHIPLVMNTLLKIGCLVAAGAEVTVTHPFSFCHPQESAIFFLQKEGIRYIDNLNVLKEEIFDLYFDCGAELYRALGAPRIGSIELTGSGDHYYRSLNDLSFPVVSIDPTYTKQLETVFGCAESCHLAIAKLCGIEPKQHAWLIWGFGKIGRGLAYFCKQHQISVTVVDIDLKQLEHARALGIHAVHAEDKDALPPAIAQAGIVLTATGREGVLDAYPKAWFVNKILANLGIYDEFGNQFAANEVLNGKKAINFVLNDPTPMRYIDPEFYLHNTAALELLNEPLAKGMHDILQELDTEVIARWCNYHNFSEQIIREWFLKPF